MIATSSVTSGNTSAGSPLLASTANNRWVDLSVENADVRIQYDGGNGSYLNVDGQGQLLRAGERVRLEGAAAKNAIYARATGLNARVTIQSAEYA